jgi:hypothetical protein
MGHYGNYPNPELCSKYGCHKLRNIISMGCPGCLITERERQELLIKMEKEAKEHAVKDQKIYILYSQPDGGISYMSADAARAAGVAAIKYISFVQ